MWAAGFQGPVLVPVTAKSQLQGRVKPGYLLLSSFLFLSAPVKGAHSKHVPNQDTLIYTCQTFEDLPCPSWYRFLVCFNHQKRQCHLIRPHLALLGNVCVWMAIAITLARESFLPVAVFYP